MLGSQNSYSYESEKTMADSILESCANAVQQPKSQQQQQQQQPQPQQCSPGFGGNILQDQESIRQSQHQHHPAHQRQQQSQQHDRDSYVAAQQQQQQQQQQQRESNFQLQQHEREQHLHQLQSINNLFLETSTQPTAQIYSQNMSCSTPIPSKINPPNGFEDQISDLLNYGLSRNPIVGSNPREPQNHKKYDSTNYSNYYQNHEDSGYGHSNNSSTLDIPSSPSSLHTPASPSTPGSVYSSQYSYSSVPSSPYTNNSVGSNGRSHQFPSPPSGRACYGRAIRGSPPYSDCSSPTTQYSHMYNCNGSRSNSPADSDTSSSSIDGPLSDIMNCLSVNSIPQQCPTAALGTLLSEPEKCCSNNRPAFDIHKLRKLLNSQQRQSGYHHHHHHNSGYGYPRNHHHHGNSTYGSDKCCQMGNHRIGMSQMPNTVHSSHSILDKAARNHRNSAAQSAVSYTWSGQLPARTQKPVGYSPKVFCGGAPWDINEATIISTFKQFGQCKVEWPPAKDGIPQKGFFYLIMESEKQVKALLSCCTHAFTDDGATYFYKISSKRMKGKEVEVIPWNLNDSNFVKSSSQKLDPEKTVFVGALHGMITAAGLAKVMNDLFDNVIYAGIDTDKFKYPIGSARVTFSSKHSFNKAVNAGFVEIKTPKFGKVIQVDPYIEDAPCSSCYVQQGPYFCRETTCFKYFCHTCWQWQHASDAMSWHRPMSRGLKNNQVIGLSPNSSNIRSIKTLAMSSRFP